MKPYLTTSEAAVLCQVSRGTILRWIREGHIEAISTLGGHNRLSVQALCTTLEKMNLPIPPSLSRESHALKILLVNDDADVRIPLKTLLKNRFPAVPIREARNGFEAGVLIEQYKPNFILLNADLAGLSGEEVCRMIRSICAEENIFILSITGHGSQIENSMLSAGADACLGKPFNPEIISRYVNQFLNVLSGSHLRRKAG